MENKYAHPKWKSKRKEILQRDDYMCQTCGRGQDDGTILHAHHYFYARGRMIWEYANEDLVTLCEYCHNDIEHEREEMHKLFTGMNHHELRSLTKAMRCALESGGLHELMCNVRGQDTEYHNNQSLQSYYNGKAEVMRQIAPCLDEIMKINERCRIKDISNVHA